MEVILLLPLVRLLCREETLFFLFLELFRERLDSVSTHSMFKSTPKIGFPPLN